MLRKIAGVPSGGPPSVPTGGPLAAPWRPHARPPYCLTNLMGLLVRPPPASSVVPLAALRPPGLRGRTRGSVHWLAGCTGWRASWVGGQAGWVYRLAGCTGSLASWVGVRAGLQGEDMHSDLSVSINLAIHGCSGLRGPINSVHWSARWQVRRVYWLGGWVLCSVVPGLGLRAKTCTPTCLCR